MPGTASSGRISYQLHDIMSSEIMKVCERAVERWGPHQLCIATHDVGYVHPVMLLGMLERTVTDQPPESEQHSEMYCGPSWESREIGQPFNDNIEAFPDRVRSMLNSWVENISSIAYDLYQEDIQDYVPWCEIKKILQFYQSEAKLQIRRYQNEDPENLGQYQTRYLEELRINSRIGYDRAVQPPVIRERCEWQIQKLNDLFFNLCVPEIDERYPEGLLSGQHSREDIAQWWAVTIQQKCRLSWFSCRPGAGLREDPDVLRVLASVGWTPQQDRDIAALLQRGDQEVRLPEPPDTSPIERPIVIEPVHPAKKKLTELLYFIEEKRESWDMNEGDYLKISDMMKKVFESI
jgi:hypothetical protein